MTQEPDAQVNSLAERRQFSVYFGSKDACGDVPNPLDVSEGWNYLMRVYRPGASIVDGRYTLPVLVPAK